MNERIGKLAVEAGAHWEHGDWNMPSAVYFSETGLEKFAELIVRECEKVISDGRYSDMACKGNSHRVSYNNGRYGASLDIKKHFGIEE